MTTWGNICRICASPADYELFDKIPIFLHANFKDFQHWQSPINELITSTTGLKITRDDGLPQNICALCISYLKHAYTFREKTIETCLSFIAVKEYKDVLKGEKELKYDKILRDMFPKQQANQIDENSTQPAAPPVVTEDDNSTNCFYKDQNKVNKRLITTSNKSNGLARSLSNQTKNFLLYLTKIHDKNAEAKGDDFTQGSCNKTFKGMNKNYNLSKSTSSSDAQTSAIGLYNLSRKRLNCDDDFTRNISSDEYDEPESSGNGSGLSAEPSKSNNIFSYKEKIFEEDDIMDLDELKDLISMNIESTCKEHKCAYCSRRFMFEESLQIHLKTCIDFRFAEFFEEIKNLMYIKRCKEISPHEYIRRMIFGIRKICEWLKENLIDTTLPDLQQGINSSKLDVEPNPNESYAGNRVEAIENGIPLIQHRNPINVNNNILHAVAKSQAMPKLNIPIIASTFPQGNASKSIARATPINISNNILHEIERSESRAANKMVLKKPIPILATSGLNNNHNNYTPPPTQNPERLAFLEKLQNAAKGATPPPPANPLSSAVLLTTPTKEKLQYGSNFPLATPTKENLEHGSNFPLATPTKENLQYGSNFPLITPTKENLQYGSNFPLTTPTKENLQYGSNFPLTPLIGVRQDLMEITTTITARKAHVSPLLELLQNSSLSQNANKSTPLNPCARCPQCNLIFETLDALEIHNAMQHNAVLRTNSCEMESKQENCTALDEEHKRIIALFENEDEF